MSNVLLSYISLSSVRNYWTEFMSCILTVACWHCSKICRFGKRPEIIRFLKGFCLIFLFSVLALGLGCRGLHGQHGPIFSIWPGPSSSGLVWPFAILKIRIGPAWQAEDRLAWLHFRGVVLEESGRMLETETQQKNWNINLVCMHIKCKYQNS